MAKATGTDSLSARAVAPAVAPTSDSSSKRESIPDNGQNFSGLAEIVLSAGNVKGNARLTTAVAKYPQPDSNRCLLAENQTS